MRLDILRLWMQGEYSALDDGGGIHGDHQLFVGGDGPNRSGSVWVPFGPQCSGGMDPPCAKSALRADFLVIPGERSGLLSP